MIENYLGEIRLFPSVTNNNLPAGWHLCDGSLLPISQNQALYTLIGNQYGGTAPTNFALPDLRGRVPLSIGIHSSILYEVGNAGGVEDITLAISQIPAHTHLLQVKNGPGSKPEPNDILAIPNVNVVAPNPAVTVNIYNSNNTTTTTLHPDTITNIGGQKHTNLQPFLVLSFCIALTGNYPPRP